MQMKIINPAEIESKQVYKLMTGSIVPRPIAWVSSVDANGTHNLAPFSYFTAVDDSPPTVLFCVGRRGTDGNRKDTYHNVKSTGEFVVNFVSQDVAEAMVITAVEAPADVDEFARAGVTPIASDVVAVPRVQESPIHFECKRTQIVDVGKGHIVIGEVVRMHFDERVFRDGNYIDAEALRPVARLAGSQYALLGEFFDIPRPPSEVVPKE